MDYIGRCCSAHAGTPTATPPPSARPQRSRPQPACLPAWQQECRPSSDLPGWMCVRAPRRHRLSQAGARWSVTAKGCRLVDLSAERVMSVARTSRRGQSQSAEAVVGPALLLFLPCHIALDESASSVPSLSIAARRHCTAPHICTRGEPALSRHSPPCASSSHPWRLDPSSHESQRGETKGGPATAPGYMTCRAHLGFSADRLLTTATLMVLRLPTRPRTSWCHH